MKPDYVIASETQFSEAISNETLLCQMKPDYVIASETQFSEAISNET